LPFHVEIRRSFHRARAFNLSDRELHALLDPWARGAEIELGDRRWEPRDSRLTVLEGPELGAQQLAFGQGWQNAERSAEDVTARLLRGPAGREVALLAQTEEGLRTAAAVLEALGLRPVEWGTAAAQTAVIVAGDAAELDARHAFRAGVAVGALGARAIVVDLGTFPVPAELRDHAPIGADALAARLRGASD
jgi:hypothetical protein